MPDGLAPRVASRWRIRGRDTDTRVAYLGFCLGEDRYALAVDRTGEILRIPPMTRVPRSSDVVMSIVGVRGRVLTVLDVRARLGLPTPAPTRHARIVVVPWSENESVGLYVDRVVQVYRMAAAEIESAAAGLGRNAGDHVMGIARVGGHLIVVLRLGPFHALMGT